MLLIKDFLKDIKLEENTKNRLEFIWEEIEEFLEKFRKYPEESQKIFLQDYLIKEVANSSKIENAMYSFDAIRLYDDLLYNRKIDKEVLKNVNMSVRYKDQIIEQEKYINYYSNMSYSEYLENEKYNLEGNYRKTMAWIGPDNDIEKAVHVAPKPEEIEEYMEDFFNYCNNEDYIDNEELNDPIVKAVLLHVIFIKIHPFANGNGRTARILLNNHLRDEINKKYNLEYPYPPINLSMSFDLSKSTYNEKQNAIIYKDGVDNNEAINSWVKYNIIAISEQLYYLDERLDEYSDMFTNDEKIK